ncbi:MAG: transcriptional regulator, partial [Alphaproteobacteria bacterium]
MGTRVESSGPLTPPLLEIDLLGPLAIRRGGVALPLPPSRKARALLAYLALAARPVPRAQLCELLWDVPNDPRGELRWCLSKIRPIVDAPDRRRIAAQADAVGIDLADCRVDAVEIARATQAGLETLPTDRLRALAGMFAGELLEGMEIDRSPAFDGWLAAQRRRFRGCQVAILEHLVRGGPGDSVFADLEKWRELAPFDLRVHEALLDALAARGRIRDGEEHLAVTARLFESEGLDAAPLREWWRARVRAAAPASPARPAAIVATPAPPVASPPRRRGSIAIMPFVDRTGGASIAGGPADGLAHDVITRLAKLRSLFVIAPGSVFALRDRQTGPEEAGRMLDVDYVASGSLRRRGARLTVSVELAESRSARILWAEDYDVPLGDTFPMLDEIGDRIVAAIAREIEMIEIGRAVLRPPASLDAWEAYHRGLWHMYRFNRADNLHARQFFETALGLDRTFARAHAGMSFTHFQDAFQGWTARAASVALARACAGESLMADDRDPAAHWAMGRALWLDGRHDESVAELQRTVDLSPNFALGHYTLAFVHSQAGDAQAAVTAADHSRHLSPFDPLLFGILGARAMALTRLGRFEEAADWGMRAAGRPNAHVHILGIAALTLALAGRLEEARAHVDAIR